MVDPTKRARPGRKREFAGLGVGIVVWMGLLLGSAACSGLPLSSEEPTPSSLGAEAAPGSRWYVVEMLGQRSGYFHEEVRQVMEGGRPVVRVLETLHNQLSRLNGGVTETVAVTSKTTWRSTPEGATLSVESLLDQGGGEVRTLVEVKGETATVSVYGASGDRRFEMPWNEETLSPKVAEEALQSLVGGREDVVHYTVFSFEAGNVLLEMTARVLERRDDGTVLVEQEFGGLDAKALEVYSAESVLLSQEVGPVVLRLATREEALAPLVASLNVFERIVVSLSATLPSPRAMTRGRYALMPRAGGEALSLADLFLEDGRQRISTWNGEEVLTVAVPERLWEDGPFVAGPYLRASSLVESDDPRILQVARSAARGEAAPLVVARRLESWVHANVSFSGAGIGLASARSTLDSKDGDCTENAFLLAALLRAVEIPSRIVVGLVAVGSGGGGSEGKTTAFVPHAWVEAWVEAEAQRGWITLDSAVYSPPVDASHLAMAKSDGGEEGALVQVTAPLLRGLGKFDLRWVGEEPL